MTRKTRRRFLLTTGTTGIIGVSGCVDTASNVTSTTTTATTAEGGDTTTTTSSGEGETTTPDTTTTGSDGDETSGLAGQQLVLATEYEPEDSTETFESGEPITIDMVAEPPESTLAAPANSPDETSSLLRLHRVEPDRIEAPTNLDWVDSGFVAYSAICTHLGCTVGWEEADDAPSNVDPADQAGASTVCPCHRSSFDPYQGGVVIGGPAEEPLPQIGVAVRESGVIELTSEFESEIET